MKKLMIVLIFSLFCNTLIGQQKEAAEKLVDEGIALHDKGDYEGAIVKYDKALQLDMDNLLALAEKAMSLLSLQKYDESIENCQRAILKHQGSKTLKSVYVTCGNAYDGLLKPDKALEIYDDGIKLFPNYHQLYFNKGITLSGVSKYDDAIICFQKSASLNPSHASSQNALGRLLNATGQRIPALFAICRFLILEPQTKRSEGNLSLLQSITKANVEQTDKNSVNISLNPGNANNKEKATENCFASIDLVLSMSTALDFDKKYEKQTEAEKFIRKFETVCSSLKEEQDENYGFYWEYYAPYFIEMKDKGFIETFAYIAFATTDYADVDQWLNAHQDDIEKFYKWSGNFNWRTK